MADPISIWTCALAGGEGFTSDSMGQACGCRMSNLQPRIGPIILDTFENTTIAFHVWIKKNDF